LDLDTISIEFDVITGLCALIVSVCALGLSIWQGFETRKNYRLSVVPRLGVIFRFSSDSEFCGISLKNFGIGPAIIEEISIELNGKSFNYLTQPWPFLKLIQSGIKLEKKHTIHCVEIDPGNYLPAKETQQIIFLKDFSKEEMNAFLKVLLGVSITVGYKSIYGKSYKSTSVLKIPK